MGSRASSEVHRVSRGQRGSTRIYVVARATTGFRSPDVPPACELGSMTGFWGRTWRPRKPLWALRSTEGSNPSPSAGGPTGADATPPTTALGVWDGALAARTQRLRGASRG